MKKLSKFFITFTVMATLFLCPLSVFAIDSQSDSDAYTPFNGVNVELNMVNSSGVNVYTGVRQWAATQQAYNIGSPKQVSEFSLGSSSNGLFYNYWPDVFDYYLVMYSHTSSYNYTQPFNFSFVPARIAFSRNNCDGASDRVYLEDINVTHRDSNNSIGFGVSGKIPDNLDNMITNYIIVEEDENNKTIGGEWVNFQVYIFRFPKGSLGDDGSSLIIHKLDNLIEATNNVETAVNTMNDLLSKYGASVFSELDKSEDKETISDLNDAEKELIGDTSDHEARLDITINPTANRVVWDSVDTFVMANGKVFAMFITLLSLGFIKLVLNR